MDGSYYEDALLFNSSEEFRYEPSAQYQVVSSPIGSLGDFYDIEDDMSEYMQHN